MEAVNLARAIDAVVRVAGRRRVAIQHLAVGGVDGGRAGEGRAVRRRADQKRNLRSRAAPTAAVDALVAVGRHGEFAVAVDVRPARGLRRLNGVREAVREAVEVQLLRLRDRAVVRARRGRVDEAEADEARIDPVDAGVVAVGHDRRPGFRRRRTVERGGLRRRRALHHFEPHTRQRQVVGVRPVQALVVLLVDVVLLEVRQNVRHPAHAHRTRGTRPQVARQAAVGVVVVVHCQANLLQVVLAGTAGGGLAHFLHGRQQQADEDRNNRDHHQQLDQSESAARRRHRMHS